MTLQYPSQSMPQMINGAVRVFPVIPDDNETTEGGGGASNVTKGSHISRGQWAHQVTSATPYILLLRSYAEYQISIPESEKLHFDVWCEQMRSDYIQFYYRYSLATGATYSTVSEITT